MTSKCSAPPRRKSRGSTFASRSHGRDAGPAIDERSAQNVGEPRQAPPPASPPARVSPRRRGASPIRTKSPRALLHPPRRGRMRSARKLATRGARTDGGLRRSLRNSRHASSRGRCLRDPRALDSPPPELDGNARALVRRGRFGSSRAPWGRVRRGRRPGLPRLSGIKSPQISDVTDVNECRSETSSRGAMFTLSTTSTTSASSQIARWQRSSPSGRPHGSPRRLHVNDSILSACTSLTPEGDLTNVRRESPRE